MRFQTSCHRHIIKIHRQNLWNHGWRNWLKSSGCHCHKLPLCRTAAVHLYHWLHYKDQCPCAVCIDWHYRGSDRCWNPVSYGYSWFDNEVNGAGLSKESYDTNGWGLSAEIGKSINYKETDRRTYSWQPKLQLTYTKLNNDTYTENNGSTIAFGNEANLQTRLGLRWLSEQNTASTKKDSFFAEVNWLHNSNNYTISSLGDSISQDGNKNLGELRLGYEKEFNKDWFISADLSGRFGSNSYSSFQGMLSLRVIIISSGCWRIHINSMLV